MTTIGARTNKSKYTNLIKALNSTELSDEEDCKSIQDVLASDVVKDLCNVKYIRILLRLYLKENAEVLNQVNSCLNLAMEQQNYQDSPPLDLFEQDMLDFIVKKLMPSFKDRLEKNKDVAVLSYWNMLVRLMGKHLHTKTAVLNGMMTVVEKAFKIEDPAMLEGAFRSWQVLMSNFALDPKILGHTRRINLLTRPLDISNAKTEGTLKTKFSTWWHLITLLGPGISQHVSTVLLPFIKLCYGPKLCEDKSITPTSPRTPNTPVSPVKKFGSMEKLCLEALVQMLGHRPLDQALPRPQLQTLPCTAFTPLQLCESANLVLYAVLEATALISPGNRTEVLKISVVWSGVGSILGELSSASTQTAVPSSTVQAGLGHYFSAVRTCVVQHRRQEKLYTLLLSIISDAASLPARILNSSSYSADHKRPSSFLLELLLYQDFLSEASSNKEFNTKYLPVLTTLVSKLVTPPASLSNMSEILAKVEMVVPGISQPCLTTLSEVWITMAETASKLEVGEKQSSGIESYSTALHLLVFPLSHLHWRGVGKDSRLWKAWDELYQAVASQAELSVSHTTAHIAHELGEKMVALLGEGDSLTPQQLAVHARCTRAAIDVLDMSSLARSIKPDELLAGFRRIVTPVGSATPLVNHLKALCSHLETLEKEKLEGSTEHLSSAARDLVISIRSLSGVTQAVLVRPILKIVSPLLSLMMSFSSIAALYSGLVDLMDSTYTAVCSLLKARYSGEYTVELLEEVQDFLVSGMESSHRTIRNRASETWAVTFSSLPKANLPVKIAEVLKRSTSPCKSGRVQVASGSDIVSFPSSSSGDSFSQKVTAAPGLQDLISGKKTPSLPSPGGSAKKKMPAPQIQAPAAKKARKSLSLQLQEENSADFVVIKPNVKKKRVLTDHQKDVLTKRNDDIPALYSELSRDDSMIQLPAQFQSQDSMSMQEKPTSDKTDEPSTDKQEKLSDKSEQNGFHSENENAAEISGTEKIEEFDSQSDQDLLRKTMKQRKNQRFDPVAGTSTERAPRSPRERRKPLRLRTQDSGEKVESIGVDEAMACEPEKPKDAAKKILFHSSEVSINGSVNSPNNSFDEVIESSQDATNDGESRRRSRRSVLTTATTEAVRKATPSPTSSPRKKVPAVDKINKYGETPLHIAAKKGDVAKVKELLEEGASPNIPDAAGWFPLHEAAVSAEDEAVNIVSLLVENGAELDVSDGTSLTTPLHDAVQYGSREVVLRIVRAGADTGLKNLDGKTALDLAAEASPTLLQEIKEVMDKLTEGDNVSKQPKKSIVLAPKKAITSPVKAPAKSPTKSPVKSPTKSVGRPPKSPSKSPVKSPMKMSIIEDNDEVEHMEVETNVVEDDTSNEVMAACNTEDSYTSTSGGNKSDDISQSKIDETLEESSLFIDNSRKSVTETVDAIEAAEVACEAMPEDLKTVNPQMAEEEQKAEEEEATSLDANKENVSSNSDSEEADKSETVEKSLSPPPLPQPGRVKSPFTNLNDKMRGAGVSHKLKQSGSNSRGAMLLSLATSRKASMDLASAPAMPSPAPLLSPSPKVESAKRPWMKYAPSPSHASPTTSCLKRTADDLDSSIEGSPVSAKRTRLSEMGSRRVHFNENPVSDSVEIPRVPDGKHTRKKLQLTGYDQDLFLGRAGGQTAQDKAPEIKLEVGPQTIFPDLASCQEPITSISHQLATGPWGKVLEADLKSHNITKICQLASMDCGQVRLLRGIKPPKEVTVRNALKGLHTRLKKETVQPEAAVRVRAPVVEAAATQEEEEEIKAALFARPSPTPTEEGDDHPTSSSQVMPGESPHMSPIQSPVKNYDITEENELQVRNGAKEHDAEMQPKEELVEMAVQAESSNNLDVLETSSDAVIDVVNDEPVEEAKEEIKENKIIPLKTEETIESSSQENVEMEVENEASSSLHVSSAQQEEDRVKSLSLSPTEESNRQEVAAPVPALAHPDPAMEPLHHLTQFLADPAPPLANLSLSDLGVISRTMARLVEIQSQLVTRLVKDNA